MEAQQDLRARPHAHQFVRDIQCLAQQPPRLADDLGVNYRQKQRVVRDVVLHQQQDGNIHGLGVVQDVALVFDVVDDRDENARVPLPQEDAVDVGLRVARDEVLDFAMVVGQHDDGNIQSGGFDVARQLRGVHVADLQVGDDQVEARLRARQFHGFLATGDVRDARHLMKVQFQRFADQQFIEPPIFAQDERVVEAGDEQNVVHAERHQVLEAFEEAFGGRGGIASFYICHVLLPESQDLAGTASVTGADTESRKEN